MTGVVKDSSRMEPWTSAGQYWPTWNTDSIYTLTAHPLSHIDGLSRALLSIQAAPGCPGSHHQAMLFRISSLLVGAGGGGGGCLLAKHVPEIRTNWLGMLKCLSVRCGCS